MNIKKLLIVSLILMFLIVPVSFASDGDYTLPQVIKDTTVRDDGATVISEDITFSIDGYVNGVYRDVKHTKNQNLTDISVETPGYYNKLMIIEENGYTRLKVYLYKDEAKTQKVHDEDVRVIFKYTFINGVKIYNDIAELQYMTWGDEWETKVDHLESKIHIPGSKDNTEYWDNPEDYVISSEWTDSNTLSTISENIPSETLYEQRILMPKSYFKSYDNAQVINMDAKAQIEQQQKEYKENREFQHTLSNIISAIMGILLFVPVGIYALFGREPKTSYDKEYEYDLPTDSSPLEVNSIVIGDVGTVTDSGMYATILDLINRRYFKVISSNEDDTIIKQTEEDTGALKQYEKSVVNYLSKFSVNGDISLKSIGDTEDPQKYHDFKVSWQKLAEKEVPKSLIDSYFIDKGSRIFSIFSYVLLAISILAYIIAFIIDIPNNHYWIFFGLATIMLIESIIMLAIPNTFAGKWTISGKEYHDKWKSFENYITDFSLIKERPPASIQVWGKYLVYAAALNCADEVSKNMKEYFDINGFTDDYFYDSNVVYFAYYGGFHHMDSSFTSLSQTDSDSGIGGAGGGGFGGGGGGTF